MNKLREQLIGAFKEQTEMRRSLMELENTNAELHIDTSSWEREKTQHARKRYNKLVNGKEDENMEEADREAHKLEVGNTELQANALYKENLLCQKDFVIQQQHGLFCEEIIQQQQMLIKGHDIPVPEMLGMLYQLHCRELEEGTLTHLLLLHSVMSSTLRLWKAKHRTPSSHNMDNVSEDQLPRAKLFQALKIMSNLSHATPAATKVKFPISHHTGYQEENPLQVLEIGNTPPSTVQQSNAGQTRGQVLQKRVKGPVDGASNQPKKQPITSFRNLPRSK
ncbi:kinesin-like protein KIF19 [Eretmochelys imbricata]